MNDQNGEPIYNTYLQGLNGQVGTVETLRESVRPMKDLVWENCIIRAHYGEGYASREHRVKSVNEHVYYEASLYHPGLDWEIDFHLAQGWPMEKFWEERNEEYGTNWSDWSDLGRQFKYYCFETAGRYHGKDGQFDERPGQSCYLNEYVVTEDNEIRALFKANDDRLEIVEARVPNLKQKALF